MNEIKDFGSHVETISITIKTLLNSGYYMATMFKNFP